MGDLKVFKMDEYSWVIARDKKEAIDWYMKQFGLTLDELDVHEVDYDSTDSGYWGEINMSDFDVPQIGMFKNWHGMFCRWIWYRDAIEDWTGEIPAAIASTEV